MGQEFVKEGDKVPLAMVGSTLGGRFIIEKKSRNRIIEHMF